MAASHRRFDYRLKKARGLPAKRPKTLRCLWCRGKIDVNPRGRLPKFCSHSCRQRGYERSKWRQPFAVAFRKDHARVATQDVIRQAAWELLKEVGLVKAAMPPERRPRPKAR